MIRQQYIYCYDARNKQIIKIKVNFMKVGNFTHFFFISILPLCFVHMSQDSAVQLDWKIYYFFKKKKKAYGSREISVLLYGGGNVTRAATDIAGKKDDISVLGKSLPLISPTPDIAYDYLLHCHKNWTEQEADGCNG